MIKSVIGWLEQIDVVVHIHTDEEIDNHFSPSDKKIVIKKISNDEQLLYLLLHEAGHAVLHSDPTFHKETYPTKYQDDPDMEEWVKDILQEEYDAWHEAFFLSEELGIELDYDAFEERADKCLNSYRLFAHTVDRFMKGILTADDEEFSRVFQYFSQVQSAREYHE